MTQMTLFRHIWMTNGCLIQNQRTKLPLAQNKNQNPKNNIWCHQRMTSSSDDLGWPRKGHNVCLPWVRFITSKSFDFVGLRSSINLIMRHRVVLIICDHGFQTFPLLAETSSGHNVYCLLFIGLKTATGRSPLTAAVKTHTHQTHTHTHSYVDA